ncbi:MAG: Zn-dependent protease [Ignavibacteriae bacterium HGW-Ignavibacteriae-2]|jgi:uncharacterized Ntn-hydrolase superfamily protein|nr:DUF1028 domain-containing protein [Bacteroidota bacterium]PKL88922.1 MAG: Zn-dependent protease [Ignavibacteriae bacterium HGW-Ignavibacteriae-2]
MKTLIVAIVILSVVGSLNAQVYKEQNPLAHTFSIVARDSVTGEIGVAVQSHWYSVGTIVSWGEAGVGVVATQSFVNPAFGPNGLALIKEGLNAKQVVEKLIAEDNGRDYRQLSIMDSYGNAATFTGKNCIAEAGHLTGKDFSVQANMMLNNKVPAAMAEAYKNSKGQLAERLLAALQAAQSVGGDIRGKQSAAILVVKSKSTGKLWEDRIVDIRVDDNPDPIMEIARILKVHRAYEHMNRGDLAMENGDTQKALEEYSAAEKMFPNNLEMKFWHAVTLVNNGKVEDALPIFKVVFDKDKNWKTLLLRLPNAGLLNVNEHQLKQIDML